ncbi:MAG: translation initiation factor [Leptolyngbyaceae cyanobacterium RU_5_1]|nr:translation initiation factor [Leptolyngbyaceae cyanobacterium RU_5_1]
MSASHRKNSKSLENVGGTPSQKNRVIHREFGAPDNSEALERGVPDLPPNQQNVRVEASSKGRKGKTVTIIRGFQSSPEKLTDLLKKLKTQCGAGGTLKDNEIEIQGDHKQKIVQYLIQLGYKAKGSGGKGL